MGRECARSEPHRQTPPPPNPQGVYGLNFIRCKFPDNRDSINSMRLQDTLALSRDGFPNLQIQAWGSRSL